MVEIPETDNFDVVRSILFPREVPFGYKDVVTTGQMESGIGTGKSGSFFYPSSQVYADKLRAAMDSDEFATTLIGGLKGRYLVVPGSGNPRYSDPLHYAYGYANGYIAIDRAMAAHDRFEPGEEPLANTVKHIERNGDLSPTNGRFTQICIGGDYYANRETDPQKALTEGDMLLTLATMERPANGLAIYINGLEFLSYAPDGSVLTEAARYCEMLMQEVKRLLIPGEIVVLGQLVDGLNPREAGLTRIPGVPRAADHTIWMKV